MAFSETGEDSLVNTPSLLYARILMNEKGDEIDVYDEYDDGDDVNDPYACVELETNTNSILTSQKSRQIFLSLGIRVYATRQGT